MTHNRQERPDFEKLLDWVEGRLTGPEAESLAEWERDADAASLAELAWIRSFAKVSDDLVRQSLPPGLRAELEAVFDGYAGERERPGVLRRIAASLSFDSGLQASFGVRSAGSPSGDVQRQVSFETGVADIFVSIQPAGGGTFDLLGQILPTGEEDPEDFAVQLTSSGEEVSLTSADDLGEFAFEGVSEGTFQIVLTNGEVEISTPAFDLGV